MSMSETANHTGSCLLHQIPSCDRRSQGGVKFPTGGDSPRAPFGSVRKGQADPGAIPEPTVKVRMQENQSPGKTAPRSWPRLGTNFRQAKDGSMTDILKIAFIKARWHADIVDQALFGFRTCLDERGAKTDITSFGVPGAFEMPLLAQKLGRSGRFDAIICAALVVDGGIYRHEFVAQAVIDGLMRAQLDTGVPVFSVSLTPHHFQPTAEHIDFFRNHFVKKGAEAAEAVLMTAALEV